jgi:hypothetical protein
LSPHQLATRLSYFLTAGPPDEVLRSHLAKGPMTAEAIRSETDRLLDSPRGDRFLRLFTEQWLGLNKLGTMPPSKETFPAYHIDRLEPAMKEETWRFVAELVRTNQHVTGLVDAVAVSHHAQGGLRVTAVHHVAAGDGVSHATQLRYEHGAGYLSLPVQTGLSFPDLNGGVGGQCLTKTVPRHVANVGPNHPIGGKNGRSCNSGGNGERHLGG